MEVKEGVEFLDVVTIVTIKKISVLYKGEDPALNIEKIELEENDFPLVAQKGLYKVGDKVVYIQPDYNLPDIVLFESFIRPFGDPKKSILGLKNRIRAKKFAFHSGDGINIYSVGILLPKLVVDTHIKENKLKGANLTETLGIYKYEEPEPVDGGKQRGGKPFPHGMYMTDEANWNNVGGKAIFPGHYVGSLKRDGSSITIYSKKGVTSGICSRKLEKPMMVKNCTGVRTPTFLDRCKMFLFKYGLIKQNVDLREFEMVENDDKFILLGKPYLDKLNAYCKEKQLDLVLRGEANGGGWKGSGNKNNPHNVLEPNIAFFGLDDYEFVTRKLPEETFEALVKELDLTRCDIVFKGYFETKESLVAACEDYFKDNLVEGIVVRNFDSTFSAKYMSLEYDSKK